jgi:hypothetical protein
MAAQSERFEVPTCSSPDRSQQTGLEYIDGGQRVPALPNVMAPKTISSSVVEAIVSCCSRLGRLF